MTAGYVDTSEWSYVWNQVARFSVPLFILLSGLSLLLSDRNNMGTREFLKKRYSKILFPYLIWSVLYFVYAKRHELGTADPIIMAKTLVLKLGMGTAYVHLYFLVIMCQLYVLYPFLKRWLQQKAGWTLSVSLLLTLGMHVAIYLHFHHVIVLPSIKIPYVILFPVWLFYFVLGMFIASRWETFSALMDRISIWQSAVPWLTTLILLIADSKWKGTYASSTKPSTLLYTLVSLVFLYKLASVMMRQMGKSFWVVTWFSAHSFFVYLIHPFVISQLHEHVPILHKKDAGVILLFIATFTVSCVLVWLGSRLRFIHLLGGVYMPLTRNETGQGKNAIQG